MGVILEFLMEQKKLFERKQNGMKKKKQNQKKNCLLLNLVFPVILLLCGCGTQYFWVSISQYIYT